MGSLDDTEVTPGQILADKFRVERVLGKGGMGVVVLATHLHLDEQVAIKFLLPEALAHPEAVRRFEREARAAVKIKSEHVARVTDVGVLPTGSPYMVMEYLRGMDLGQYLEQRGPLPIEEAVDALLQALEAIAEAHSLGIVHRDLKPANLFRVTRPDGTPSIKVLDFGISKVTTGDHSMTRTSSMMGSPYYMSPEQMTNAKAVDARADVWALGIILHELLTGRVPYQGETIPEICAQVLQEPPPSLRELRPGSPVELERIIARALEKKRDDRYPDVAELARALADFASPHSRLSADRVSRVLGIATPRTTQPSGSDASVAASTSTVSTGASASGFDHTAIPASDVPSSSSTLAGAAHTQTEWRPPTSGPSPALVLGGVLGALLLGGGVFFRTRGGDEKADVEAAGAPLAPSVIEEKSSSAAPSTAAPNTAAPTAAPPAAVTTTAPQNNDVTAPAATTTSKPSTSSATTSGKPTSGSSTSSSTTSGSTTKPTSTTTATTPAATTKPATTTKPKSDLLLDRK